MRWCTKNYKYEVCVVRGSTDLLLCCQCNFGFSTTLKTDIENWNLMIIYNAGLQKCLLRKLKWLKFVAFMNTYFEDGTLPLLLSKNKL